LNCNNEQRQKLINMVLNFTQNENSEKESSVKLKKQKSEGVKSNKKKCKTMCDIKIQVDERAQRELLESESESSSPKRSLSLYKSNTNLREPIFSICKIEKICEKSTSIKILNPCYKYKEENFEILADPKLLGSQFIFPCFPEDNKSQKSSSNLSNNSSSSNGEQVTIMNGQRKEPDHSTSPNSLNSFSSLRQQQIQTQQTCDIYSSMKIFFDKKHSSVTENALEKTDELIKKPKLINPQNPFCLNFDQYQETHHLSLNNNMSISSFSDCKLELNQVELYDDYQF
jgi:hypothetical protein